MEHHNPLTIFILWMAELMTSLLVSMHLNFDLNDFRVWSLWSLSIVLGMAQLIMHRKSLKQAIKDWYLEMREGLNKK